MISGFLIDLDALILKTHRKALTHSPIFWLIISAFIALFDFIRGALILISAMAHLLIDSLDWGIYILYPITQKLHGPKILAKSYKLSPETNSILDFIKANLRKKELLALEIIIDSLGLLLLVTSLIYLGFINLLIS